jgi:hypothetical protein
MLRGYSISLGDQVNVGSLAIALLMSSGTNRDHCGSLPSSVCDEFDEQKRQLGDVLLGALYPYGL